MKILSFTNYAELSLKTAEMIADIIRKKPDALLCFPAGDTSVGTFEQLVRMNKEGQVSFKKSAIVGLDEWLGLGKMKSENCYSFLKKHIFDHIDFSPENFCFFDGESADPEGECHKTDSFIRERGPIDMILLGAGMNGHLALNEPGTPFDICSHVTDLDHVTKNVGQKYFSESVVLTRGITLGMKHILESRTAILQLSGKRKAPIAARLLKGDVSIVFPASAMKIHPDSFLLMDSDAAGISDSSP